MSTNRIDPGNLSAAADVLFGDERMSGPKLADEIGEKSITVWSWFNRRGMPAERAEAIATALDAYALRVAGAASQLRRLAELARAEEAGGDRQEAAAAG